MPNPQRIPPIQHALQQPVQQSPQQLLSKITETQSPRPSHIQSNSKILNTQIQPQDATQMSIIKDTSVVRSPVRAKEVLEDSIIYGKFDSLIHGSTASMVDLDVAGSHAKPEEAITPIMNVRPAPLVIQPNSYVPQPQYINSPTMRKQSQPFVFPTSVMAQPNLMRRF